MADSPTARVAEYASDAEYHADRDRLSGSNLDMFDKNPRQFAAWKEGQFTQPTTKAMAFGSLFHCHILEPAEFVRTYAPEPERDDQPGKCIHRGSNAYREWAAETEASKKTVVTVEEMALVRPMAEALLSNPHTRDLLTCTGGVAEVPLHFEIGGFPMRAKLDRVIPGRDIVVELKTSKSVTPNESNAWAWERFGYARKAWLYLEAYRQVYGRPATMVHIFAETGTPFPQVSWFWTDMDSPAAQWGESEALRVLGEMHLCNTTGDFRKPFEPGAPEDSRDSLPIPGPILSRMELMSTGPVELEVEGNTVTL